MKLEDLAASTAALMPDTRRVVEDLVRIRSVSLPGFDPDPVRASALATATQLERTPLQGIRLLETEGAHPAVFGHGRMRAGRPTVLLYAHHDVMPIGEEDLWDSPPFEAVERSGRLYGRGTADDKAAIAVHINALRSVDPLCDVNVKVIVEGEEEASSPHLAAFLAEHAELLKADVIVVCDGGNWKTGVPSIGTSTRGIVDCIIEVRVLNSAVHSGGYGGPLADAFISLSHALASLHDPDGDVAVAGLVHGKVPELDISPERFAALSGARPGCHLLGRGTIAQRLWEKPAINVLGIDGPRIAESGNRIVEVARARVSLRLAPGDDPDRAMRLLTSHLSSHVPWGGEVSVREGARAKPYLAKTGGPGFQAARSALEQAWGVAVVTTGEGGTIPMLTPLAEAFPQAEVLLTGVADPACRAHGENESLDLADFERACLAEALLLEAIGRWDA
ncbi:MAG: M20/M25/M40 family metallo-hydrolase [Streptosporangiaceae bacterium]